MSPRARAAPLCAAAALALGCAMPVAPIATSEPAPVVLGAVYNLTGPRADQDAPSARGARLAVLEANRDGGVLGRPVDLERFPSTPALIGLSDDEMVLAAAPVAALQQRLFLTSGATSPRLPSQVRD